MDLAEPSVAKGQVGDPLTIANSPQLQLHTEGSTGAETKLFSKNVLRAYRLTAINMIYLKLDMTQISWSCGICS